MIKIVVFLTSEGIQLRSENSIVSDSHSMGSPLLTYYIGNVGHVPGGAHGFLVIFLGPASYCK